MLGMQEVIATLLKYENVLASQEDQNVPCFPFTTSARYFYRNLKQKRLLQLNQSELLFFHRQRSVMYDTVSLWIVDHFRAITSFKAKDVSSRNICVIVSTYRQRKSFSKVFRFHENLQPDGFSVKLKREKKAQTQVVIIKYMCLTFLYQLHLDTQLHNRCVGNMHCFVSSNYCQQSSRFFQCFF